MAINATRINKGFDDLVAALFALRTGYLLKTHVHSRYKDCAKFFFRGGLERNETRELGFPFTAG
jgi:hypothetical protein